MGSILLPDSGPLFSFAAGEMLEVLLNFDLVISDVVKTETIDQGASATSSFEAVQLAAFYATHRHQIHIQPTQVGYLAKGARKRHAGELSIQSIAINTEQRTGSTLILFEDRWFIRNQAAFSLKCTLLSTSAFLVLLEESGLIHSAAQADAKIRKRRPQFPADRWRSPVDPAT